MNNTNEIYCKKCENEVSPNKTYHKRLQWFQRERRKMIKEYHHFCSTVCETGKKKNVSAEKPKSGDARYLRIDRGGIS